MHIVTRNLHHAANTLELQYTLYSLDCFVSIDTLRPGQHVFSQGVMYCFVKPGPITFYKVCCSMTQQGFEPTILSCE